MEIEDIQKAIEAGPEAVKKIIDSEADRRVNAAVETARQKFEAELPERIDTEIEQRKEQRERQEQERAAIAAEIDKRFEGTSVTQDIWADMIDMDGLLKLEGEDRTAKIDQEAERVGSTVDKFVKSQYSGRVPTRMAEDSESAFKNQLLENMKR